MIGVANTNFISKNLKWLNIGSEMNRTYSLLQKFLIEAEEKSNHFIESFSGDINDYLENLHISPTQFVNIWVAAQCADLISSVFSKMSVPSEFIFTWSASDFIYGCTLHTYTTQNNQLVRTSCESYKTFANKICNCHYNIYTYRRLHSYIFSQANGTLDDIIYRKMTLQRHFNRSIDIAINRAKEQHKVTKEAKNRKAQKHIVELRRLEQEKIRKDREERAAKQRQEEIKRHMKAFEKAAIPLYRQPRMEKRRIGPSKNALYIFEHLSKLSCNQKKHMVFNDSLSMNSDINGKEISIPVHVCQTCGRTFISRELYNIYIPHGIHKYWVSYDDVEFYHYKKESDLHSYGYRVGYSGLSISERRALITKLVESKKMTLFQIHRDLTTDIKIHQSKPAMAQAVHDWRTDLQFVGELMKNHH